MVLAYARSVVSILRTSNRCVQLYFTASGLDQRGVIRGYPGAMSNLSASDTTARTIGELRRTGWQSRPVAEEIRQNTLRRLAAGEPLVDGVRGYEDTVIPQLANAILAGHDMVLLGERGQAKTRIIRSLVGLLDEYMPIIAGSEINDDPFAPVSAFAIDAVSEHGDGTPIEWVHRDTRYGEKLATPDTSIADLIGEVDPIKVAEGRYLSDAYTLHYGLIPRTNRGIFAINELPDLAERIQVGLLNVLEERDVQIRGYKVRLPLDVMLVASANPEDYTNRGRMITPLKDRFGAQIRTHYPVDVATESEIMVSEAAPVSTEEITVDDVDHMTEIVATLTHLARSSANISQHSGVSVRMSVANLESIRANALRRALSLGETSAAPRVSDLAFVASSTMGKLEVETFDEGREGQILERLVNGAVLATFRTRVPQLRMAEVIEEVTSADGFEVGDDVALRVYREYLVSAPAMAATVAEVTGLDADAAALSEAEMAQAAAAVELVLDGLHLSKRLNKNEVGHRSAYSRR